MDVGRVRVFGLAEPPRRADVGQRVEAELARSLAATGDARAAVVAAVGRALDAPVREVRGR